MSWLTAQFASQALMTIDHLKLDESKVRFDEALRPADVARST